MAKDRIATIKGTFAVPGVSKNRRLYTKEHIADAVSEAQSLLHSGKPLTVSMMTSHGARDPLNGDVTRTAGRVTKVGLNAQGHGTFEADIADTSAGHDIAALTTPDSPYLTGVSMASMWKGSKRTVNAPDGSGPCETADGFSLKGIDFTHNPGVNGAEIHTAELAESAPGDVICESLEEVVFVEQTDANEAAAVTPRASNYADPGYQDDKRKRYPLDTAKHVRAAWAYINQGSNAKPYSPAQLKRIKGKIKSAAKKFDINIAEELTLLGTEIMEAYASVCLDNGPGTVSVSAYTDEPAQLAKVGQSVAMAALAGLYQLDPDCDGDIDLAGSGGAEDAPDDDQMESCSSCNSDVPDGALYCPTCGAAVAESAPAGSSQTESETTVSTSTETQGAATESTLSMTQDQLNEAIAAGAAAALEAAGIKPAETDPAKIAEAEEAKKVREAAIADARKLIAEADGTSTTETTPTAGAANETNASATFTPEQVKEMVTEAATTAAKTATDAALDVARKEIREAGPRRRGLVLEQSTEEVYGENADLSKLSTQDLNKLADVVAYPLITR